MKKILIFLLLSIISSVCCFVGCSGDGNPDQGGSGGVTVVSVTGVTLSKSTVNLTVGNDVTLTATVSPSNATNKNVTFSSSNELVASVDANGKVTGKKAGTATITVSTADGSFSATCSVTVKNATVNVTGVSLNMTNETLTVGSSITLRATVSPSNATNKNVTFSTSNKSVATVDANGKVTGIAKGSATITVTTADGSFKATCSITIKTSSGVQMPDA